MIAARGSPVRSYGIVLEFCGSKDSVPLKQYGSWIICRKWFVVLFSLFRFSICASLDFCMLSCVTSIRVSRLEDLVCAIL